MHATTFDLELFVSARLDPERSAWLESHCEGCVTCARAVAREARLEVALTAMTADRRCGMRADAALEVEAAAPVRRPRFYALAGAVACVLLAFAAARLPRGSWQEPAAGPVLLADAGDLVRASPAPASWALDDLSGGTP